MPKTGNQAMTQPLDLAAIYTKLEFVSLSKSIFTFQNFHFPIHHHIKPTKTSPAKKLAKTQEFLLPLPTRVPFS